MFRFIKSSWSIGLWFSW